MHEIDFEEAVERIQAKDPRYGRDVYLFLRDALEHTQKSIGKDNRGRIRHVTGQELLGGIREYALAQYGPMALMLLEEWGIRTCADFGNVVFNMIAAGLLAKTDKDTQADFQDGYDFNEAFRKPFLPAGKPAQAEAEAAPAQSSDN